MLVSPSGKETWTIWDKYELHGRELSMAPEPVMIKVSLTNSHVRFAPQVPLCARRLSVKQKRNAISDRIFVVFILL